MRISRAALLVLMLGGCHRTATIDVPEADRIECAIGGAPEFARDCAVEHSADATRLMLRHPNGGFRRLDVASDGTLSAADGADVASGHPLADGRLEVSIGNDRYRLPARK